METTTYRANGMTCEHCAKAVSAEVGAIPGVEEVDVELVPGGTSILTVTSAGPIDRDAIAAALDEAGDYTLADTTV